MKHLAHDIYGILTQFGYLNSYVILKDDKVVVVDVGTGAAHIDKIEQGLQKHGLGLDAITHIFITHAHFDHCGGLSALQKRSNATTYAHRLDAAIIRGERSPAFADPDTLNGLNRLIHSLGTSNMPPIPPARVDIDLSDDADLDDILSGLRVLHLPGHSHGQVGYWLPDVRALIGGDVMMRTPFRLTMPFRAASPDWAAAQQSIRRMTALDVDMLCLGHGQPIISGAAPQIAALIRRFD